MNQKNSLMLDSEFLNYCIINKIEDPVKFAENVFRRGFTIIKYGETPVGFTTEKVVEKEVIVEKEVVVEKMIESNNSEEINKLIEENKKLKEELDKITVAMENFNRKGTFMRDSNLSSLYDE